MSSSTQPQHAVSLQQGNGSSSSSGVFVNPGLARWEQIRTEWLRPKGGNRARRFEPIEIDPDDIVERIFGQTASWQLEKPVPLPQMVDVLVDLWESEGLYDKPNN